MENTQLQTFLPHPSFAHSAHVLDRARLGKQRSECVQLLNAIVVGGGWQNHPAARMWRGCEAALGLYTTFVVREWEERGYVNNLITPYDERWRPDPASSFYSYMRPVAEVKMPRWLGDEAFHASHRSNLLRKAPEHYGALGWSEPDDLPYVWPRETYDE